MKRVLMHESGRMWQLGKEPLTLGRGIQNSVVIADRKVNRTHTEIRPEQDGDSIVDLNTLTGTFLNGERLQKGVPYRLSDGDTIQVGQITLTYKIVEAEVKSGPETGLVSEH